MRQRGGRTRFADQPIAAFGIRHEAVGQHFDRDGAAQARVARAIDLAHPARADAVEDFVTAERLEHERRRL